MVGTHLFSLDVIVRQTDSTLLHLLQL